MGRLDGNVAIVTGASSGIGEATVRSLIGEGAKVAAIARRANRLEELKREVRASLRPKDSTGELKASGEMPHIGIAEARAVSREGDILALVADVRNEAECDQAVQDVLAEWGRIDILVNNAGVMLLGPIVGADTEDWRRMIDTNLYGLIYCTHKVLPQMRRQKSGHIVNISSTAGRTAALNSGVYNLTKWGVNGFSESLRQELVKDRIRVTIIEPGAVNTELRDHITVPEVKDDINRWAESMEQLESEDIANAIVFALTCPQRMSVNEVLIRPTDQQR